MPPPTSKSRGATRRPPITITPGHLPDTREICSSVCGEKIGPGRNHLMLQMCNAGRACSRAREVSTRRQEREVSMQPGRAVDATAVRQCAVADIGLIIPTMRMNHANPGALTCRDCLEFVHGVFPSFLAGGVTGFRVGACRCVERFGAAKSPAARAIGIFRHSGCSRAFAGFI